MGSFTDKICADIKDAAMQLKKKSLEEAQFQEAKRQIMEMCVNAYEEGRKHEKYSPHRHNDNYGGTYTFESTKVFKIIDNLKTVNEQMKELLLHGGKS